MIKKTKLTKAELEKAFTLKRDTYLTTEQALKLKVIDHCVTTQDNICKIIDNPSIIIKNKKINNKGK